MPKPPSGKKSVNGLIANDKSKRWKVQLNFKKNWKRMQSLYSEKDGGKKMLYYLRSLNSFDNGFNRRYQNRHQYLEDVYWETRKKIDNNFHNGKITENEWKKQLYSLYAWKYKGEKKIDWIRGKETAIYEALREKYITRISRP